MLKIFEKYGFFLTDEQAEKFNIYKDLLLFWNKKFNLTSIKEEKEIFIKHFIDSLLGINNFCVDKSVIDIGAGGGFPSIPLKILRKDLKFTLVEATAKKCTFLKECVDKLKIEGVEIVNKRAEDLAKDENYREMFDYGTARAVARLNTLCEYVMPFVKVGGCFIPYKGRCEEELYEAKKAVEILGGTIKDKQEFSLEGESRSVIVIEKIKNTPVVYPRGRGKERSNPIK